MLQLKISIPALLALCAAAQASQSIGSATQIEKIVDGLVGERSQRLKVGDAVFANELLTTGDDSKGKFVFDDRATLQMGPLSQVRLDDFVHVSAPSSAPAFAFNVTRGALRFVSAPGAHKPYEVRTHNATIGVRGTAFAVRSTARRTDAVLYEGAIEVCLTNNGACRTLDKPCTSVAVTESGFTETHDVGAKDWSFDDACKRKPAPTPRRRHGAIEPPISPPPAPPPRRASRGQASPREAHGANLEPPRVEMPRPKPRRVAIVEPQPKRPHWPRRPYAPPFHDDPGRGGPPYDPPPYDPPLMRPPPVIFGGGPFHPHFPGGWGGRFPR
ncbi:MAG: FecR family protein, partial [Methylocystis sp.]|nr:FecR family protein [Methylocystis sp.]